MDRIKVILPVFNLDIDSIGICYGGIRLHPMKDSIFQNYFESEYFLTNVGSLYTGLVRNNPCFVYQGTIEDAQRAFGTNSVMKLVEIVTDFCVTYTNYMSMVKSHSVSIGPATLIVNEANDIIINFRGTVSTNAAGVSERQSFVKEELNLASGLMGIELFDGKDVETTENKKTFESNVDYDLKTTSGVMVHLSSKSTYNENRTRRAMMLYSIGMKSSHLVMKISFLITALECIFSNDDRSEVAHKVAERAALSIGKDVAERSQIFKSIKDGYDIRSKFFHGQQLPSKVTQDILIKSSQEVDHIARHALWTSLNEYELYNTNNKDVLERHFKGLLFSK